MVTFEESGRHRARRNLAAKVDAKERQKQKARSEQNHTVWFGLGMFGLVGWSVTLPALIGIAIGLWVDSQWPSRFSWTLMLLVFGVALGCANAWRWVSQESREQEEDEHGVKKHDPFS